MTVTVKANEAKEEKTEEVEVIKKEKVSDKLKAKAEKGKGFLSRNKAKIGAAVAGAVGAVALGALAMVAKEKVDSGEWDISDSGSLGSDEPPFEGTDI